MSTDDPRPEAPTVATIAEDLSLSNAEGTSWFGYRLNDDGTLGVELYGDEGEILKTFVVRVSVEESGA